MINAILSFGDCTVEKTKTKIMQLVPSNMIF